MDAAVLALLATGHNPWRAAMYRSAAGGALTGSTFTTVPYDTAIFDPNGNLTVGAGALYTVPVDGYYAVSGWYGVSTAPADGTRILAAIYQAGSVTGRIARGTDVTIGAATVGGAAVNCPSVSCLAGDTLAIQYYCTATPTLASGAYDLCSAYFAFVAPR
jgi:hypothetical protein